MNEDDPAAVLTQHGFKNQAARLRGLKKQPSDTRGSVWATAQRCAAAFEHEAFLTSIRPTSVDVEVFDPAEFVTSTDTLILLGSRTGGSSSALVSALVWDVFRHGAKAAQATDNGRLITPLVMELDEVGNAVSVPELPEWYSYAGSLGIVISAYFQSLGQGQSVFGKEGMNQLMGAAAAFAYGGGSNEEEFVSSIAKLVGQYDHHFKTHSTSYNPGSGQGRSTGQQIQRRDILSAADLSNLPAGKIFVKTGDGESGLLDARYWFKDKELAERITPQLAKLKSGLKAGSTSSKGSSEAA